jgi:hypothetical protein
MSLTPVKALGIVTDIFGKIHHKMLTPNTVFDGLFGAAHDRLSRRTGG